MRFQVVDNYRTSLAAGVNASATTLELSDVSRVPSNVSSDFPLALTLAPDGTANPALSEVEIVHVTAVDSGAGTVTVTRGEGGSSAKSWVSGAVVGGRLPAHIISRFLQTATLAEQKAANASVNPSGFWLTTNPFNGSGPESAGDTVIGDSSYASGGGDLAFGYKSKASGYVSCAGGWYSETQSFAAFALGGYTLVGPQSAYASALGNQSFAPNGASLAVGDLSETGTVPKSGDQAYHHQILFKPLGAVTDDGTATEAANHLTIGQLDVSAMAIQGQVLAVQQGGSDIAWWSVKAIVRLENGTATVINSSLTEEHASAGASGWSAQFSVMNPFVGNDNNAVTMEFTGEAGKTIRWVAALYGAQMFHREAIT